MEMARGEGVGAFARACLKIAWVRGGNALMRAGDEWVNGLILLGFGCGKENFQEL
jgi:hypothetical protein